MPDSARSSWLRFARSWRAGVVLILLALAAYLPGLIALPPVDRDECRFAQASRQMFEAHALPPEQRDPAMHSGGWAVPYFTDRPRLNKPPLVYWLQVASAWTLTGGDPLRDAIWMYRVPSVLSAIVTVLATWWFGKRWLDARAAWLAAALLAVAPMFVWDAAQARADQLMVACTTITMGALGMVYLRGGAPGRGARSSGPAGGFAGSVAWALVFWIALAGGVLAKGFVTPMVALLAALALAACTRQWRWLRQLRPGLGVVVLVAAVAPWLYFVAQHQGGIGPFLKQALGEFFVRGAAGSKEGHFAPPGTHLVLLAALFWPGSLLTLAAIVHAFRRAKGRTPLPEGGVGGGSGPLGSRSQVGAAETNPPPAPPSGRGVQGLRRGLRAITTPWTGRGIELFLLAWIVPAWVVFELSLAKLPHYTMPMFPAIALLSARMVLRMVARRERVPGLGGRAGVVIWTIIGLVPLAPVVIYALSRVYAGDRGPAWPVEWLAVVPSALALVLGAGFAWRGGYARASVLGIAAAVGAITPLMTLGLPAVVPGANSDRLIRHVRAIDPDARLTLGSTYVEESLRFATRGRLVPLAPDAALAWLAEAPGRVAIMPEGSLPKPLPAGVKVKRAEFDGRRNMLVVIWREDAGAAP